MIKGRLSISGSIASLSESSGTISDESNTANGLNKKRKQSTVNQQTRPPWRPTANPVPKTVDKTALLKAKILDASRRAMMKAKIANVSTQTEVVVKKDSESYTDGSVLKRGCGEFILTNSVAQLTDAIESVDKGTQTAMPRSEVHLMKFHQPNLEKLNEELREFDQKCFEQSTQRMQEIKNLFRSFGEEPTEEPKVLKNTTHSNWTDFNFECPSLPRRTMTEGDKPWCNFKDLVLGNRLSHMTLSPIPPRRVNTEPSKNNKKTVTWKDTQELIQGANNLIKIFDQVSILLGPKMPDLYQPPSISVPLNSDPIENLEAQKLSQQLHNFKPKVYPHFNELEPEFKQYLK